MEVEEIMIRAVFTDKCPLRIIRLVLIDPLPVHPFIEGTAVVKYTVKDNPHASLMHLFHQTRKELIAGLQIANVPGPLLVFCRMDIILSSLRQSLSSVLYDLSVVRINIVIILNIIFMV